MSLEHFVKEAINRRQFLTRTCSGAAGAASVVGLSVANAQNAASNRVRVGVIGVRTQGRELAGELAGFADVEIAALCDIDQGVLAEAATAIATKTESEKSIRQVDDYRRILDDRTIDAVVIATPDHHHAVMAAAACAAGKDVYLESPLGRSLTEGESIVTAARQHRRVVQTGIEERSGAHFQSAVALLQAGGIGDVRLAKAWVMHRRKPIGRRASETEPHDVDYQAWLGTAPQRPFQPNRFHHNWRWFWDYGQGELGAWGVHFLDVARWGMAVDWPNTVTASGARLYLQDDRETPDTLNVEYRFQNARGVGEKIIQWEHRQWSGHGHEGRTAGVAFYGDNGTLVVDRGGWKVYDRRESPTADGSSSLKPHLRDFIDAVKTRGETAASVEIAHISSGLCVLGNTAYRLGQPLQINPQSGLTIEA